MNISEQVQQKALKAFEGKNVLQIIALILRYGLEIIEFLIEHKSKKDAK